MNELTSDFFGKPHVKYSMKEIVAQSERKTVFVGDSSLCDLWRANKFDSSKGVDFDCVVGGTVI